MSGSNQGILRYAYSAILKRYGDLGLPAPEISCFGCNPGWNAVIGTHGCAGIAMSFRNNNPLYKDDETCFNHAELCPYIGRDIFGFARDFLDGKRIYKVSFALAALNALSQPLMTEEWMNERGYVPGIDLPGLVRDEDIVAIVGYGGIVKEYAGRCRELHVTDQRPPESFRTTVVGTTIRRGPERITVHPADENREVLSGADVAIITGSTLANGTFDEVIGYARNARIRAIYGSSAQLFPDALFGNTIDVIMSVAVSDPATFADDIMNALDMETALRKHQRKYTIGRQKKG